MNKFLIAILVVGGIAAFCRASGLPAEVAVDERTFLIEERMQLKNIPEGIKTLRVWTPYPVNDKFQTVDVIKLTSPLKMSVIEDKEYGNRALFLSSGRDLNKSEIEITTTFKVKRKEYGPLRGAGGPGKNLPRFLEPDRLVPVNGEIKTLAQKITRGKTKDIERARAIYDYIIDELTYSKDDPRVCGVGDSRLTLEYKKGICTDYHSLFISLVRSLGIPAKFEIGFPIAPDKEKGRIAGYHCWAKFYTKDRGWIPVDISEADKHPEKRGYFFGHIDENRIHLTTGRDIILEYAKDSQPLNFFVWPYAEIDGRRFGDMDVEIWFKGL